MSIENQKSKFITWTKQLIKIKSEVSIKSLLSIQAGKYPVSWGNYFSFPGGVRCVNMWAENLEEAKIRFLEYDKIIGWLYTTKQPGYKGKLVEYKWFVVDDPRIPKNWLYSRFCFTGCVMPTNTEILKDMYEVHGNAMNQYYHNIAQLQEFDKFKLNMKYITQKRS